MPGLSRYVSEVVEPHSERSSHPLPAVILFSDGLNETSDPAPVAKQIRELSLDGVTVPLIAVGVSSEDSEPANEDLLRSLVCPEYYLPISELRQVIPWIRRRPVGESGANRTEVHAGQSK